MVRRNAQPASIAACMNRLSRMHAMAYYWETISTGSRKEIEQELRPGKKSCRNSRDANGGGAAAAAVSSWHGGAAAAVVRCQGARPTTQTRLDEELLLRATDARITDFRSLLYVLHNASSLLLLILTSGGGAPCASDNADAGVEFMTSVVNAAATDSGGLRAGD
jgi:hypothetical protein